MSKNERTKIPASLNTNSIQQKEDRVNRKYNFALLLIMSLRVDQAANKKLAHQLVNHGLDPIRSFLVIPAPGRLENLLVGLLVNLKIY